MLQVPKIIAHRGASHLAPENTIAAMRMAQQLGATWVEFDVLLTQDQLPIVMHDHTLERTTNGRGEVANTPYSVIKNLDAGRWFAREFAHEPIPLLSEMVNYLRIQQMGMNIEIKPTPGQDIATAEAVIHFLIENHLCQSQRILLSSFSTESLKHIRKRHETVQLGLLIDDWFEWQGIAEKLHCVSIHLNQKLITNAEVVSIINDQGYEVLTYTVDDPERARQLFSWGVTSIFTNTPNLFHPQNPPLQRERSTRSGG